MPQSFTRTPSQVANVKLCRFKSTVAIIVIQTMVLLGCTPPNSESTQGQQDQSSTASQDTRSDKSVADSRLNDQNDAYAQNKQCQNAAIVKAFESQRSDVQVKGCGRVIKLLADDNKGSRHQKFLVKLTGVTGAQNMTLLIAHNIDLAPRIDGLSVGSKISFYGEYEFNPKGGVVHWTHRDPAARHQDGWIEVQGKRYQ